tara:strand:+ start:279 stop:728 length:450 start_codon:yes stop_codon:yes gene_type:complete
MQNIYSMFDIIAVLPNEIIKIIYQYIPLHIRCILTLHDYKKYMSNYNLKDIISQQNWHSFIRSIVRNDYELVFSKLLIQNWNIWCKHKRYQYKNSTYHTYILFIEDYAIDKKAQKIRQMILSNKNKNNIKNYNNKWSKKSTLRNEIWNN